MSAPQIRRLHASLRAAEDARRRAAVSDRWANYHMGRDAMAGNARGVGLYMRSLARAAGEHDPLAMTAVNQAHGNNLAAAQSAGIAANQDILAHQGRRDAMHAAMIQQQMAQQTPQAQAQAAQAAIQQALQMPEHVRGTQLAGMIGEPAAAQAIAAYEAGRGNLNHNVVRSVLLGMREPEREAWLMTHWRGPDGRPPSPHEARAHSRKLRAGLARATGWLTDLFAPSP